MWKGRFKQAQSDLLKTYSESVSFDWRMYRQDIRGSIAHARALKGAGIITKAEFSKIESGLRGIEKDIISGEFVWDPDLEDVHMNIEAELTRRIGAAGARLHTARSRNDQVALDLRLYLRDEIDALCALVRDFQKALVGLGQRHSGAVMPGYTHLQRAQPVFVAHHLLAYVEMAERDLGRLLDCRKRFDECPLGSGAIAGSTIVLDRAGRCEGVGLFSGDAEQHGCGVGSGFCHRVARGPGDARHAPFPAERGHHSLGFGGIWVHRIERPAHHRIEPDAAEKEPRYRRAHARQDRAALRESHHPADPDEGPASHVQPRHAGRQGGDLRLRGYGKGRAGHLRGNAECVGLPRRR